MFLDCAFLVRIAPCFGGQCRTLHVIAHGGMLHDDLFDALGLVIGPLVRSLGFLQDGFILQLQPQRFAAGILVADDGADGREHGREHGDRAPQ